MYILDVSIIPALFSLSRSVLSGWSQLMLAAPQDSSKLSGPQWVTRLSQSSLSFAKIGILDKVHTGAL